MGSMDDDEYAGDIEKPQHSVDLSAYQIGKYPITNVEYQTFVTAAGYAPPRHWDDQEYPEGK